MNHLRDGQYTAYIGIDWADTKHDICLQVANTNQLEFDCIPHQVDDIEQWALSLYQRLGGPIAIALELAHGPIVYALQKYDFLVLFPINPSTLAKYREAFTPSRAKDDPTDAELANADQQEPAEDRTQSLEDKIAALRKEMSRLKKLEARRLEAPGKQISRTDPDARSMNSRGSGVVGYNVQTAVDTQHHMIVAHEVTNEGSDRRQLTKMAQQAKFALAVDELTVVADRGYFRSEEIQACDEAGITAYVPKPQTSGNRAKGQFGRDAFRYIAEDDEYECPAGERLVQHMTTQDKGRTLLLYWTSKCRHAQSLDGFDPLPDQDTGSGEYRDESACAGVQLEANDEPHWHETVDRGDSRGLLC